MHDADHAYQMGYIQGMNDARMAMGMMPNQMQMPTMQHAEPETPKKKRKGKVSAYNRRLGKAIKDLTSRHKTKAGKWKKGWSQKRMMQAAHKAAKR